jgi:hypothetical protein
VEFGEIPPADAGPDTAGCSAVRIGTPGFPLLDYRWDPPDGLSSAIVAQPMASPATPTVYTLTVTDPANGCFATDDVLVTVSPVPGAVSLFALSRSGDRLRFGWSPEPDALTHRVYSETDVTLARGASASSPTAFLECTDPLECEVALAAGDLIFYQVVGVCVDGSTEGPN